MATNPEKPLTDAELAEIIGSDEADVKTHEIIQVCAGDWVRRVDDQLWGFDPDPEWDEDPEEEV